MFYILCLILIFVCGLCNRFAGGLLSKLIGKDLGDFLPRQIWGFAVGFSCGIICLHEKPELLSLWYFYVSVLAASVVMGLLRGLGWGNSLRVGFDENGKLESNLAKKQWPVFFLRAMGMNTGVMILLIFIHTDLMIKIAMIISAIISIGLGWLGAYVLAFTKPLDIPKLGMTKNDPPPTGEFYSGMLTVIIFLLYCL